MIYTDFKEYKLSRLGFGAMRLPLKEDKSIDVPQVEEMVDIAMANGVNYFDTAYPYHGGFSETVLCKALSKYDRSSYYLADKYPGHQFADTYDPAGVFEEQLEKCGVDYFDFYLLHNVNEGSASVYMDEKWGIVDYFVKQKEAGRIKHLGFSTHARCETLRRFLEYAGEHMEFCQIQLNYVDWTLQDGKGKCEILKEYGIPVWVMEPLRGGKLANLKEAGEPLHKQAPERTDAEWAFSWLMGKEDVKVILSGMSDITQMKQNVATFETEKILTPEEEAVLLSVAEGMKDSLPCTSCRYCMESCPMELNIPLFVNSVNELRFGPEGGLGVSMAIEHLPADKQPSACLACGNCVRMCPQNIDIPAALAELAEKAKTLPSWLRMCEERNAAALALREKKKSGQ